jgi:hypothetical protein
VERDSRNTVLSILPGQGAGSFASDGNTSDGEAGCSMPRDGNSCVDMCGNDAAGVHVFEQELYEPSGAKHRAVAAWEQSRDGSFSRQDNSTAERQQH